MNRKVLSSIHLWMNLWADCEAEFVVRMQRTVASRPQSLGVAWRHSDHP
jgi:hypothetical protein